MVPPAGVPSPARHLVRVVLPAPLRPTRPMRSPLATRKVAFSTRTRAPARSSIPEAVITDRLQGVLGLAVGGCGRSRRLMREENGHGDQSNGAVQAVIAVRVPGGRV